MGTVFKDKNGNIIAKLLQFVATDEQVNQAITDYLDKNGITLAEGIDLKKMSQAVDKNTLDLNGVQKTVESLQQIQNNVLLQYKDHFISEFEAGYIDNETGESAGDTSYMRSTDYALLDIENTSLILTLPEGYQCSFYFYNEKKEFQGATEWMYRTDAYRISSSQIGWYVKAVIYSNTRIDLKKINIILAGNAVTDILDKYAESFGSAGLLGKEELSASDKLELNTTKASLQKICTANTVVIPFLTDLHITCTDGKTPEELAKTASKIRRHIACYNILAEEFTFDLCAYGGDYLNNSPQTNKETAVNGHKAVRLLMDKTDPSVSVLVGKGNHDDNTMYTDYKNGYVDSESLYKLVTSKDAKAAHRDMGYRQKSYGYYDIPDQKIRVFMLNSDDVPTSLSEDNKLSYGGQNNSGFSQEQIQFVADNLLFNEGGWQVLFFSHHPLKTFVNEDTEAAGYTCSGVTASHGGAAMLEILTAFKNKEKGTVENTIKDFKISVDYDFTRNKSSRIIASICGHTHVYCHKLEDDIHYIATRAVLGHPTYNYISTSYYIVIDRQKCILYLIANGDGEDYTYVY